MEINTNKQPNIPINNPLTMENKYTNIDEFNSLLLIKHEIKSMQEAIKNVKNKELINFYTQFVIQLLTNYYLIGEYSQVEIS